MNILGVMIATTWLWLIAAVVLGIVEALTVTLTTIWFATGAVAACIAAAAGAPESLQFAIFLFVSVMLLVFTRPIAVRKLKVGHEKNVIDQMEGKLGIITKEVSPFHPGQIRIDGLEWTAVVEESGELLATDEKARVLRVEGVKLIVERGDREWKTS